MPRSLSEDNPLRAGVLPETQLLLAGQDLLTGLSSRAGLEAHYRFVVARARRSGARFVVGVAVMDVDPKAPHDEVFGHDLLIVEVAKRLRASLRETDLLARLGETRFAFVAEGVTPDGVGSIVDRVLHALIEPSADRSARPGGRVGLALWEDDAQTLMGLLRRAEERLSAERWPALPTAANAESFGAQDVATAPARSRGRRFARRAFAGLFVATMLTMLVLTTAPPSWRSRWLPLQALAQQRWSDLVTHLPLASPANRRP